MQSIKQKEIKMPYIKTKDKARQFAVDWQSTMTDKNLSYGEVIYYQNQLNQREFHYYLNFYSP
jgi:hypothetical protein